MGIYKRQKETAPTKLGSSNKTQKKKKNGGLSIQDAKAKNITMLSKLFWACLEKRSAPWVEIVRGKYLNNGDIQTIDNKKKGSHTWKNITKGWEECKKYTHWAIGNGKDISFWNDIWIPNTPNLRTLIQGPLPKDEEGKKVIEYINNNSWNFNNIPFVLPNDIVQLMLSMYIQIHELKKDTPSWNLSRTGRFTTKSMY